MLPLCINEIVSCFSFFILFYTGYTNIVIINLTRQLFNDPKPLCLQAFVATGINLPLYFTSNSWSENPNDRVPTTEYVDFDREPGKVSIFRFFYM